MVLVLIAVVLVASAMGPRFEVTNLDNRCDIGSRVCDISADLKNTGGAGSGTMTAEAVTAYFDIGSVGQRTEKSGEPISCSTVIPHTAHGGVAHSGCRLQLPAGTTADHYIVQSSVSVSAS